MRLSSESLAEREKMRAKAFWLKISNFLLQEDPRIRKFVFNQLHCIAGKQAIKMERKRMFKTKKANRMFSPPQPDSKQ